MQKVHVFNNEKVPVHLQYKTASNIHHLRKMLIQYNFLLQFANY